MTSLVHLENGKWMISLWPDKGGCIVSAQYRGFPVFKPANLNAVEAGDVFASSCFPLIPYSNRIAGGHFSFAARDYDLEPNHSDHIFPIHGNGWQSSWQIEKLAQHMCEMSMTYTPVKGGWPWAYKATQKISLHDNVFKIELCLENIDEQPFPAGLGFHPAFSDSAAAQVKFKTGDMWQCDDQLIPIRRSLLTELNDFSDFKKIKDIHLDNCFEDWGGKAEFKWPKLAGGIRMDGSSNLSHLVVYNDPKNDYFCAEPVTHVNNGLNMSGENAISILQPNKQFSVLAAFSP